MIKIRRNVFETNSSMTHSLVLMSPDEYNEWENGQLYIHRWYETEPMMTYDEVVGKLKDKGFYIDHYDPDEISDLAMSQLDMVCLQAWLDDTDDFYHFDDEYEVDGRTVHAIGYYGHD